MNDWKCTRRSFIKTAGWMTVVAAGSLSLPEAFALSLPKAVPNSSKHGSKLKAPANACDCHIHIFDDRFPMTGPPILRAQLERGFLSAFHATHRHLTGGGGHPVPMSRTTGAPRMPSRKSACRMRVGLRWFTPKSRMKR